VESGAVVEGVGEVADGGGVEVPVLLPFGLLIEPGLVVELLPVLGEPVLAPAEVPSADGEVPVVPVLLPPVCPFNVVLFEGEFPVSPTLLPGVVLVLEPVCEPWVDCVDELEPIVPVLPAAPVPAPLPAV
jgi:hypothetical protein